MKALALLSGGLDSILATKLIMAQGIDVEAVYFHNPFCDCNMPNSSCKVSKKAADFLNIAFHKIELKEEYLWIIRNPKHGYGKNMNPCIDCRILQLKRAKTLLKKFSASFITTGEVVNERPMSQRKQAIEMIEKEAGVEGLILRPLSAKMLKETLPEKKGIIDRAKLLNIEGRSRKRQMELAEKFGIEKYPTPSGGCLLTYFGFSYKVKDLIDHDQLNMEQVRLLKLGRHFRLDDKTKLIVGRDEAENERILKIALGRNTIFLNAEEFVGPIAALLNGGSKGNIERAASVLAYYVNRAADTRKLRITYRQGGTRKPDSIFVRKAAKQLLDKLRVTK